jgi:hypothetical protein
MDEKSELEKQYEVHMKILREGPFNPKVLEGSNKGYKDFISDNNLETINSEIENLESEDFSGLLQDGPVLGIEPPISKNYIVERIEDFKRNEIPRLESSDYDTDTFISVHILGVNILEDALDLLITKEMFRFSVQDPYLYYKLVSKMPQKKKEDLLGNVGIIKSHLKGSLRECYRFRNNGYVHNYTKRGYKPSNVKDANREAKISELKRCLEEVRMLVCPTPNILWNHTDTYSSELYDEALKDIRGCGDDYEQYDISRSDIKSLDDDDNISLDQLEFDANPLELKRLEPDDFSNITDGVEDFSKLSEYKYRKLMTFLALLSNKISDVHKDNVENSILTTLEFTIKQLQTDIENNEISNIIPTTKKFLDRKEIELESRDL